MSSVCFGLRINEAQSLNASRGARNRNGSEPLQTAQAALRAFKRAAKRDIAPAEPRACHAATNMAADAPGSSVPSSSMSYSQ